MHYIGFLSHLLYLIVFSTHVSYVYVYRDLTYARTLKIVQGISLIYPLIYDMTQLRVQGFKNYFKEGWNYMDQSYIWIGYINIFIQQDYHPEPKENWDDDSVVSRKHREKVAMIIVTFLMLLKTFFFLRIFMKLSNLVTMMRQVISDL